MDHRLGGRPKNTGGRIASGALKEKLPAGQDAERAWKGAVGHGGAQEIGLKATSPSKGVEQPLLLGTSALKHKNYINIFVQEPG